MDFFADLGILAVASRLRRLTERLMQNGTAVYSSQGIEFEPRWFPVFYLLNSQEDPLSITEIARHLGLTHPAIIEITNKLAKKGLIKSEKDTLDGRKRLISLSEKGRALISELEPIWEGFEVTVQEMFDSLGIDIIGVVQAIEDELDNKELSERIIGYIKKKQLHDVVIVDYDPKYKDDFRELNYAWIEKYFEIEEGDEKVLANPEKEILSKGGHIFFAVVNGQVAGTVAMSKAGDGYVLSKMSVWERYQGKQAGKKLAMAVINKAKELGADAVYLCTDRKLTKAVGLYRSLGFAKVSSSELDCSGLKRSKAGFVMKLAIG